MNKLTKIDNIYNFNNIKEFKAIATLVEKSIEAAFEFAYKMSFGHEGEHRAYRSGGSKTRRQGEIFINTFQGKLAEFTIYNTLYEFCDVPKPDLDTYGRGK
jgi:hypothetical protein